MSISKLVCISFWKPNIYACILPNACSINTSAPHNTLRAVWEQSRNPTVLCSFLSTPHLSAALPLSQGCEASPYGCPIPSPFVFMLVRMKNAVMVWEDAFILGDIWNLFFSRKHPCTFANSSLHAWLWRSSLVLVCLAPLLPLEHSSLLWLPLLCTLQSTVFYSVLHLIVFLHNVQDTGYQ